MLKATQLVTLGDGITSLRLISPSLQRRLEQEMAKAGDMTQTLEHFLCQTLAEGTLHCVSLILGESHEAGRVACCHT